MGEVVACGRSRRVVVNGLSLHAMEWGEAPAPAVLLLHSLAAHSHWWDWVAPLLAKRRRLVALDFRGHGRSQWVNPAAYTFEDHLSDVVATLDLLGLDRPIVIGHSMGGHVGAFLAATHPDRVRALVIADVLTGWTPEQADMARRQAARSGPAFVSPAEAAARFRLVPPDTRATQDCIQHLGEMAVTEHSPGTWEFAFDRQVFLHPPVDPWPFLPAIDCPTLVIRGDGSSIMSREAGKKAAQVIPRARFAELAGTFHHLILDDPGGFSGAINGFLAAS